MRAGFFFFSSDNSSPVWQRSIIARLCCGFHCFMGEQDFKSGRIKAEHPCTEQRRRGGQRMQRSELSRAPKHGLYLRSSEYENTRILSAHVLNLFWGEVNRCIKLLSVFCSRPSSSSRRVRCPDGRHHRDLKPASTAGGATLTTSGTSWSLKCFLSSFFTTLQQRQRVKPGLLAAERIMKTLKHF